MEQSINRVDYFPELRLTELQRYAKRWAKKYLGSIGSIAVYNYTPKRIGIYKELWGSFPVKYALVFEIFSEIEQEALQKLKRATEQNETIHRGYPVLFDNRFFTVYADKSDDDYYKHWVIFLKRAGQEMPLGVLTDEPYWVLYDARSSDETNSGGLRLNTSSSASYETLSAELFPKLNPLEFTRRTREWIEKWSLINEVRLYAGKGIDNLYVLIIRTADKAALNASGFWTDSLIPLQSDLASIHRNANNFSLSQWKILPIGDYEDLPAESIHSDNFWFYFETSNENIQDLDEKKIETFVDKVELADEKVLWVVYSRTREVLLKDVYGHSRCLAKPNFDSVNDNFFAHVFENAAKRFTLKDLSTKGINLNNKSLHKVVDELGFKGKVKKLFFKVTQGVVVFNNPITRKDLLDTNIVVSETELSQIFFV